MHKNFTCKVRPFNILKGLTLLLLAIAGLLFTPSAHATSLSKPPNNLGLVGYWSFNEGTGTKAGDMSGNGNTGTLTNGPSWTGGKLGYGLRFDGTDDYVSVGAPSALAVTSNFTLSAWVKSSNLSGRRGVVSKVATGSDYVIIETNGATFRVAAGNLSGTYTILSSGTIDTNWHHVVFNYDGTTSSLYVDGTFVTSAVVNLSPYGWNTGGVWLLGGNESGFVNYFSGSLDDVRIYNRALGANEITRLYQAGAARVQGSMSDIASGLIGYWKLDDATGTRAIDVSGKGNNGTLTNGPVWRAGRMGGAVSFDGVNDYIDMGVAPALNVTYFTTSAWIYPTSSADAGIVGKIQGYGSGVNGYIMVRRGGKLGGMTADSTYTENIGAGTTIPLNQWSHVVMTYDGTNLKGYLNNVLQWTTPDTRNPTASGQSFGIGLNGNGVWPGLIDDVRVYNRALTAEEIRALYSSGTTHPRVVNQSSSKLTANTSLASGLVGHWTFDGADMTGKSGGPGSVKDVSGNGGDGVQKDVLGDGRYSTRTLGRLGQASTFDRTVSKCVYVSAGSPLSQQGVFSFSGWGKFNGDYTDAQGFVSNASSANGNNMNYFIEFGYSDNKLSLWHSGAGPVATSTRSISDDSWHHYAVVRTGSTGAWTVRIYIDGVLDSTTSSISTNPTGSSSDPLTIASTVSGSTCLGGYFFHGALDDIRIYNRALSATEVKQLYDLAR